MPKVKPMLAKLVNKPFDKKDWYFEVKWDGYRAIAEVGDGKALLYSRTGTSFTRYEPIIEALKKIKYRAIFDGEIIALKNGKPDFHTLQNFDMDKTPLQYVIFDLIEFKGRDLRKLPLRERKMLLKKNFPKNKLFVYSEHVEEKGVKFFETIKKQGLEGIVAKDAESSYQEGLRTGSWQKVKYFNTQEAIIVGFTAPRGSRKFLGALVLGAFQDGELKYIGHSGGGFTSKEIKELYERLNKYRSPSPTLKERIKLNAPITWVSPKYVCQIEYSEWTPDGRMRHPIYKGMRVDKKPEEVIVEKVKTQKNQNRVGAIVEKVKRSDFIESGAFTNLEKIYWPREGYTKGDLIKYYEKIAPAILPYLLDRPESLNRHPNGIDGKNFFQKDIKSKVPEFVDTKEIWSESNQENIRFLLCQNKETLLYLANLGCIELNPWNSRIGTLDNPDYMIIDLDPGNKSFKDLVKVAQAAHELLEEACEHHFIKTSGKKGLHIFVPLGAKYDYDTIRIFSEILVRLIHKELPELTSVERNPKKRGGKIYLDYLQNRRGQTIAAPYSVRPWPGATVSTPLDWKEVNGRLDPSKFTIKTIFKRLSRKGDLWKGIFDKAVDLNRSIKCLNGKM